MKATVLALSLLCAGAAFAQPPSTAASASTPSMSARAAQHMNNLATLLDLTDAQKTQVRPGAEAGEQRLLDGEAITAAQLRT